MKTKYIKYPSLISFILVFISGCINYDRSEAIKSIFVNHQSLSLFVGEQKQLVASPTDGTYNYNWYSEDNTVATVTENGLVNAVSEGSTNIIVNDGDVSTKILITSVVRVPVTDVILSEENVLLASGDKRALTVYYSPGNANDIPKFSWVSDNPEIATVNQNGEIVAVTEGNTTITYRLGDIVKKITVFVSSFSKTSPFKGPHIISASQPLVLLAANFDFGGEGYAFHDSDDKNSFGENNYRSDNGDLESNAVDILNYGELVAVLLADEWLLYTVDVVDAGEYYFDISQAAMYGPALIYLEVDGINVTGEIEVPATGGYFNWTWAPATPPTITLSKGVHKIRLHFVSEGPNLRALRFTKK